MAHTAWLGVSDGALLLVLVLLWWRHHAVGPCRCPNRQENTTLSSSSGTCAGTLLVVQFLLFGWVEGKRWMDYRKPQSQGEPGSFAGLEGLFKGSGDNGYPGGIFDPLGELTTQHICCTCWAAQCSKPAAHERVRRQPCQVRLSRQAQRPWCTGQLGSAAAALPTSFCSIGEVMVFDCCRLQQGI